MENKKGQGVFLGVVAVATLIVAIIGATFAYFSASVTANNNVTVTAYNFDMEAEIELVSPADDFGGLIPLDADATAGDTTNLLYAVNTGVKVNADDEENTKCVDSNGHQVCALYKVTITNNGAQQETLSLSVTSTSNTFTDSNDLKLQMLSGSLDNHTLNGTAVTLPAENGSTALDATYNQTVAAKVGDTAGTTEFYFVVYFDDTGITQNDSMGDSYIGTFVMSSGSGNQLTGTFNLS